MAKKYNFDFLTLKNNSKEGKIIFFVTIFLVLFGVVMVYSASYYFARRTYNNQYFDYRV